MACCGQSVCLSVCLSVQIGELCTSEVEASRHNDLGDQGHCGMLWSVCLSVCLYRSVSCVRLRWRLHVTMTSVIKVRSSNVSKEIFCHISSKRATSTPPVFVSVYTLWPTVLCSRLSMFCQYILYGLQFSVLVSLCSVSIYSMAYSSLFSSLYLCSVCLCDFIISIW